MSSHQATFKKLGSSYEIMVRGASYGWITHPAPGGPWLLNVDGKSHSCVTLADAKAEVARMLGR